MGSPEFGERAAMAREYFLALICDGISVDVFTDRIENEARVLHAN